MANKNFLKKAYSFLLSLVLVLCTLSLPLSASAESYEQKLRDKGFSESYIDSLVQLHKEYPNWEFEAFKTGLDWSAAVSGERSSHRNQIIEKSSDYGEKFYCGCEKCKRGGSYVYQYSGCVSASKWAVEYFMDPRNWLDEKHIFQFQSNEYSPSDTQSGVEAILGYTFMHDSPITYVNTEGDTVTYLTKKGKQLKYAKAIMLAAENSGMSAYYIASRMVKEIGSSKPTATGVCGTKKPFVGMYNFYSIGAGSGAMGGLEFASGYLKTNAKATLYSKYDKSSKKGTGTKTSLSSGQYMSYIGTYGDYYKVRLYSGGYTSGSVGYVLKSKLRTTYFTYGRPWTNPYKCISGGAKYIAASYLKYQNTSYLEKFNVNPASGSLHSHEYMQNVDAVSIEAVSTYNAYKKAGVLSSKHVFYIPVFNNMPGDTSSGSSGGSESGSAASSKPTGLVLSGRTTDSISLKWTAVSGASKYYISVENVTKGTSFSKTVSSNKGTLNGLTAGNKYKMKVCAYVNGKWGKYSKAITRKAVPATGKIKTLTSPSSGKIYASWISVTKASGYQLKYARDKKFKNTVANKTFSSSALSYTGKNFTKGVTYYVKVRAYTVVDGKKYYGAWSAVKSVKSK